MDGRRLKHIGTLIAAGLVLTGVLSSASCKMSDKKVAKLRESSFVFEATGTSRIFERVNVFGDPIGTDAARQRAHREAETKIAERIVFGRFALHQDRFDFFSPRLPSYRTRVKKEGQKGNLYEAALEVFVPEKAFSEKGEWVHTTLLYREAAPSASDVSAGNALANRALGAFVQRADRIRRGKTVERPSLKGEIRAVITRQETLGNARLVEIKGAARFD